MIVETREDIAEADLVNATLWKYLDQITTKDVMKYRALASPAQPGPPSLMVDSCLTVRLLGCSSTDQRRASCSYPNSTPFSAILA